MTLVVTIIIGFGVILMLSAFENTPVIETFQDVLAGKSIAFSDKVTKGA